MNQTLNKDELYLDSDFQVRLFKRIRKKELRSSAFFACFLIILSYLGAYGVHSVGEIAQFFLPNINLHIPTKIHDILVYLGQLLLPVLVYILITGKTLSDIFNVKTDSLDGNCTEKVTFKTVTVYTVIAFALSQIMSIFSSIFSSAVSSLTSVFSDGFVLDPDAFAVESAVTFTDFIYSIFAFAVLPAILEELLFRGVLLSEFIKYGKSFAIVISAFFFASVHGSIEQMMYSFVYGIIFGYVAVKTGSIAVGIIMHFTNNLYSCIVEYLGNVFGTELYWNIIMAINFCLIFLGLVLVVYMIAKNKIGYPERQDKDKGTGELKGTETFSVFVSPIMILYYGLVIFETLYIYISYNLML